MTWRGLSADVWVDARALAETQGAVGRTLVPTQTLDRVILPFYGTVEGLCMTAVAMISFTISGAAFAAITYARVAHTSHEFLGSSPT